MAPRVRLRELLLLVSAASVPLSLALTPWPPQGETIVVLGPPAECGCAATQQTCVTPAEAPTIMECTPPEAIATDDAPSAEPAAGVDFMWVTDSHHDAAPVLVLSLDPDPSWASGPPRAVRDNGVATRALDEEALPAALRAMIGQRVEAITHAGAVCSAMVGTPQLVADADGDLDLLFDTDPSDDEDVGDDGPLDAPLTPARRAALADAVWSVGRRLLVAPLAIDPGCADPGGLRWARSPGQGTVDVLRAGASATPRASVMRRFLALPELVELAQEFDQSYTGEPDDGAEAVAVAVAPALRDQVRAQRWRRGDSVAAITVATEGDLFTVEPCETFLSPRWGIATVDVDGKAGRVHAAPHSDLISVLDLEGDGQLELFILTWDGSIRLMSLTPTGLEERSVLPPRAWYGCPC